MTASNAGKRVLWPSLMVALLAFTLNVRAAVPASSQERLRRLVRLPRLSARVGLTYDPVHGFAMLFERSRALKEIDELRRAMGTDGDDASRYRRLGLLYQDLGDPARGAQALGQAVALYRRQGADQSSDPKLLAGLGAALGALDRADEAEGLLRRAVKVGPREWTCQLALSRFLAQEALKDLLPKDAPGKTGGGSATALDQVTRPLRPTPTQAEKAQRLITESLNGFDRTAELAPAQAEVFAGRAAAKSTRSLLQALLEQARGEDADPATVWTGMFPTEALADLQTAARLDAANGNALTTAALYEVLCSGLGHGASLMAELAEGAGWNRLSERTQTSVRNALQQLADLGREAKPEVAAGALACRGTLQYLIVHDLAGAETSLRQAVALDPGLDNAWDLLALVLARPGRFDDFLAVAEERLKHGDTPFNRILLAKAYEKLNQPDRSLEEATTAQRRYPDDFMVNLTCAAALIKTADDPSVYMRAAQLISRAEGLLSSAPPRDQMCELLLLRGLFFGLLGRPDQARLNLQQLLQLDPGNAEAQQALSALD